MKLLGFDIGGTKCAVIAADWDNGQLTVTNRLSIATDHELSPERMIEKLIALMPDARPERIGISCGGPLDDRTGVILSPPNLPGWRNVPIVKIIRDHYQVPTFLQNDANAGALAEWRFGAGRGCENLIFMTFGTGLGAGLILNGKLYSGTNGNAGEVGHVGLEPNGPIGFGKAGSFEGFCSGGGLAQLGYRMAVDSLAKGIRPLYFREGMSKNEVTAKSIAAAAEAGDQTALDVFRICAEHLGQGLSILIDILNPQVIAIGGIFGRCHSLLWPMAEKVIGEQALSVSSSCCRVLPAELGEKIGDYAALATALQ